MQPSSRLTACPLTCSRSWKGRSATRRPRGRRDRSASVTRTLRRRSPWSTRRRGSEQPEHTPVPVEPRAPRVSRRVRGLLRATLRRDARSGVRGHAGDRREGCVFNLNLAFLDPDGVALASDPGYPVYTAGPLLVGAEPVLMPLRPERDFAPDLDAIGGEVGERARLLFSTTRTTRPARSCPTGSSRASWSSGASTTSWSCTTRRTPRRRSRATWRRASSRRPAPRTSAWRSSRCRRAGT